MRGSKAPAAPMYVPPTPYQSPAPYQSPGEYVNPLFMSSLLQQQVPQVLTPTQVINQGNAVEGLPQNGQIPTWLQLGSNPMDPAGRAQIERNWYQQNVAPQLAAAQEQSRANGQNSGSYAGALQGQMMAQGRLGASQYGLDFAQQLFNNVLQGRQSYFSGGPALSQAQNAADIERALGINQVAQSMAGSQNAYNLDSSRLANAYNLDTNNALNNYNLATYQGANNFNLNNYQNQMSQFQQGQQSKANRFASLFGGASLLGQGLFAARNPLASFASGLGQGMFGGGSNGGSAFGGSYSPFGNNITSRLGGSGIPGGLNPPAGATMIGDFGNSMSRRFA